MDHLLADAAEKQARESSSAATPHNDKGCSSGLFEHDVPRPPFDRFALGDSPWAGAHPLSQSPPRDEMRRGNVATLQDHLIKKNLDHPDETRTYDLLRIDMVNLGGLAVSRKPLQARLALGTEHSAKSLDAGLRGATYLLHRIRAHSGTDADRRGARVWTRRRRASPSRS